MHEKSDAHSQGSSFWAYSRLTSNPYSCSILITLSILLGHFGTKLFQNSCFIPENTNFVYEHANTEQKRQVSPTVSEVNSKFLGTSELQYSCNAQGALEKLTNLHDHSVRLSGRKQRGEANRVRQATISRKAVAAGSAEQAFRECVGIMMPETLKFWDESKSKGQLDSLSWSDASEKKISGITMEVLENTADSLEDMRGS